MVATCESGHHVMKVVVVFAHPSPRSFTAAICRTAVAALARVGHEVILMDLYADKFVAQMSREERLAYVTDSPILDPLVERYAAQLVLAEGLVLIYPTWHGSFPAILKGWFERVFVPGVGWALDPVTNKASSGLRSARRMVGVSTYGSSRLHTMRLSDAGRRVIMRNIRFLAPKATCRAQWLGIYGLDRSDPKHTERFLAKVDDAMAHL